MAHSREELEIKLTGAPADIAALRRSKLFRALRASAPTRERLVSTYYDTKDGALAAAGVSLRLREEAGALIQAVKVATPGGGVVARAEEERALRCLEEFPSAPEGSALAMLAKGKERVTPVARTVSDRWSVTLEKDRTRIEAAFDFGRAEAWRKGRPAAMGPLAAAELELIDGDPKTLFKLARNCLEEGAGRLRISGASKEESARRLRGEGAWLRPERALHLRASATVADALAAALMSTAMRLLEVAPAVSELRLPEGAHQMRVALRRLRAVERVFRDVVDSRDLRKIARRAGRFARALGQARDWDVFLGETLPQVRARADIDEGFDALATRGQALRAKAWDRAVEQISSLAFNEFALDIIAAARLQEWRDEAAARLDEPAAEFARKALDERLEDARRIAVGAEGLAPAALHSLRIALKKLRYAAQTFRALYPHAERKAYMSAMARLQDALGALNDAVVAQDLSSRAAEGQGGSAARAAGFLCGFRAAEADAASRRITESWKAFEEMTPFWRRETGAPTMEARALR
ncbi:MAG: CHAD domain-containing protein [Alphaproteobacteria bacterium]|nr:CHAD domain-containing protein [Alphaproteobacteria bacterium]